MGPEDHYCAPSCRVEPKAASHVFVVHGQACLHSPAHPTCTHTKEGVKPAGKSYVVDLKPILGSDWRVWIISLSLFPAHPPAVCHRWHAP